MPFFFNNENIEVIMEDNPDDIFTPSDINYEPSSRNTTIRQLISQKIKHMFKTIIGECVVENGLFSKAGSLKENNCLSYMLTFETDDEEYEILYHIPLTLATVLEYYGQTGILEIKRKVDEGMIAVNKEIFLSLSDDIITCLNAEEFTFLQDIELTDLSHCTVDGEKNKIIKNLYSLNISIDGKEYELYLQLDNQFNKIF